MRIKFSDGAGLDDSIICLSMSSIWFQRGIVPYVATLGEGPGAVENTLMPMDDSEAADDRNEYSESLVQVAFQNIIHLPESFGADFAWFHAHRRFACDVLQATHSHKRPKACLAERPTLSGNAMPA